MFTIGFVSGAISLLTVLKIGGIIDWHWGWILLFISLYAIRILEVIK